MADPETYQVWLRFRCDDHRLIGEAEQRIDAARLWHATLRDLIDAMKPAILERYPYVSDSIDYITMEELRLLPAPGAGRPQGRASGPGRGLMGEPRL